MCWLAALGWYVAELGPGQSGIIAQGFSPDGREYCAVQKLQDWVEGYKAAVYVRDAEGMWHWHYLAHDDPSWRSIRVEFTAETIRITRKGVFQRAIKRGDLLPNPDTAPNNRPAHFTAGDVAAAYRRSSSIRR